VHINPGTHCFGYAHATLRISGGACVQNNNPEGLTYFVQTTTTISTTVRPSPPLNGSENTAWRDVGFVVLGAVLFIIGAIFVWICMKFGPTLTTPARRLLAMVIYF